MGNWITALGQQLGTQAASTGLGTIMGLALEGHNDRRQLKQQTKLQNLQITGNKQMIDYQKMKDLEMWKETGPTGMTKQLKEAGLNPALMYGMSGGGGTTTGGSGSVSGANAPQGGREIMESMGMAMQGAQLQLLNAQRKNIEADTANKGAGTANITQDTVNKKIQESIMEVQNEIAGKTQNMQIAMVNTALRKITAEMHMAETQQKINTATADTIIEQAKQQLAQSVATTELTRAQKAATEKGMEKTAEEITKIIAEVKNIKDYYELDNYIEREKVRLMDKGINVMLISSTIGSILNFAKRGK